MLDVSFLSSSIASFGPPFSVLAYRTKLDPRSCRGFQVVSLAAYSSDQILVSQPLTSRAIGKASEPVGGVSRHIALGGNILIQIRNFVLIAGVFKKSA
jgi:hypothetical protein